MSHAEAEGMETTPAQVGSFLRALARRAEREPALASVIAACLNESGLLASGVGMAPAGGSSRRKRSEHAAQAVARDGETLDPFALWRAQGEDALRQALETQSLASLRAIVRAHRLDPARVSSRWTATERVAALICDQVRARMRHGRAFERV